MEKNIAITENVGYKTLIGKIVALRAQAETIRMKEKSSILSGIKKQMNDYGITLADFQIKGLPKTVPLKGVNPNKDFSSVATDSQVRKSTRRKPMPKYQDPKTGKTWSGRGKTPTWMQAAILKGKTKEKFLIC